MTLLLSRRSALRLAAASAVTLAAPASLMAAPISYRLNPGRSRVGFGVNLGGGQENPELTLNLKGTVDRTDFGMTAYNGLVGPQVTLDIRASIKRG